MRSNLLTEFALQKQPQSLSREEKFSYRQMVEASNLPTRYLFATYIQRSGVTVVYAYHEVSLVVLVMGVLKAGATFSIIDPAYPGRLTEDLS